MITLSNDLKKRLKAEQTWNILSELQKNLEEENVIPKPPCLLLRKYESYLEGAGNIVTGCFVGLIAILFTYILCVKFLHLSF